MSFLWHHHSNILEANEPHHTPHFHAYYQDEVAVFGIDPVELVVGTISRRQQRLIEAWAELHQDELIADWKLLHSGQLPLPIQPLK